MLEILMEDYEVTLKFDFFAVCSSRSACQRGRRSAIGKCCHDEDRGKSSDDNQ